MPSVLLGHRRVLDALELELQIAMSHHVFFWEPKLSPQEVLLTSFLYYVRTRTWGRGSVQELASCVLLPLWVPGVTI